VTPGLLDLYCGAGGSGKGYHDAGFTVFGVDIENQPRYPYGFMRMDALEYLDNLILSKEAGLSIPFVAVHASPPCQAWSDLQKQNKREYEDFIGRTRERLLRLGLPYVMENVDGAPLVDPVRLCGASDAFPELRVIRHRLFESNFPLVGTPCPKPRHPLVFTHDKRKPHYGNLDENTSYVQVTGGGNCSVANARDAMGIDWMLKKELNEAIPPAYTRFVGEQLMAHLEMPATALDSPTLSV